MRRYVLVLALLVLPSSMSAQGYRLRLDSRFQSVAVRGVTADSVRTEETVLNPQGGVETSDGFAVRCLPGLAFCSYFRPGPERRGGPLVTTADFQLWGLGVRGLRFGGRSRVGTDLGDVETWPGVDPVFQLLEGYAEYSARPATVRVGRTYTISRLGFTGFDGAKVNTRALGRSLTATLYGGWGLARGVALPLTSPALNPLDDASPRRRQAVSGATIAWSRSIVDARLVYEREWAGRSAIVAERVGLEASAATSGLLLAAGADYDLAAGFVGTVDAKVSYTTPDGIVNGTLGIRRYRPHFDLWTIWGAFSPVPYRSMFTRAAFAPFEGLRFRGQGEVYEFDESDALTPLVTVETGGWRWSLGADYDIGSMWTATADYRREMGPGAASNGLSGSIQLHPTGRFAMAIQGGVLERPLEFRFNDTQLWMFGTNIDFAPTPQVRLTASALRYAESRQRPDAAAFDWNQFRLALGITWLTGSNINPGNLPPAILRVPMRKTGSP